MGGLKDGDLVAHVGPGSQAQPTDKPGAEVREDVPVEVGEDEHVVLLGHLDQLHAHVVDDAVLELDVGIVPGYLLRDAQPEAIGELHDVRLVHRGDLLATVGAGVLEGRLDHPAGAED